jgi:anaerobic C4-dicarboxylate transporter
MSKLEIAIRIVEGVMIFLVILLLGDYLGHRIGGRKLATFVGLAALVTVVVFAIDAAIVLA